MKRSADILGFELKQLISPNDEKLFFCALSNRTSLGLNEQELLKKITEFTDELIKAEQNAREFLLSRDKRGMMDLVSKSYGILAYSFIMPLVHCQMALLHLRYGICLGLFKNIKIETINKAILYSQDGHLQKSQGYTLDEVEKNALRADLMRELFLG